MIRPRCTIDASCLIALDSLDLLSHLTFLFSEVLLPKAVRMEVKRRRSTKDRLKTRQRNYAFVTNCDTYDQAAVDFLLIDRDPAKKRDRGEAEAVVQAAALGAVVIVDDPRGRQLASNHAVTFHGTLWILEQLLEMKLVKPSFIRDGIDRLRKRRIRLPEDAVTALLSRAQLE